MGRSWASRRVRLTRGETQSAVRGAPLFVAALLLAVTAMVPTGGAPSRMLSSSAVASAAPTSPPDTRRREEMPRASRGFLDLTDVDLKDASVSLEGEWEFYWGHLYEPEVFADSDTAPPPAYFSVPGGWKSVASGIGFGTYRLRIHGVDGDEPLALYVPFVPTSHALWVNGRLAATQGIVATERAGAVPSAGTSVVPMAPDVSTIELVLQVANFSFREGGIARNLVLGTHENVRANAQRSLFLASFFVASLLFIGLYHVGLWFIRRQDRQLLWFGLLSLAIAFRTSVMDQAPVTLFFPRIPWEILIKVEYIGFYLAVPLFILFLRALFPEEFSPRPARAMSSVGLAAGFFVLMTPARIHSHGLLYYEIFAVAVFAFALWALVRSVRRKRSGSQAILAAAVVTALVAMNDILFHWGYLSLGAFSPIAVLGVLGAHSLLLSKQFSDEFDRQKELAEEKRVLLEIVQQQVVQIRDSRRKMHAREEHVRRSVAELLHGTVQSRLLFAQHHLRKGIHLLEQPTLLEQPESPFGPQSSVPQPAEADVDDILKNLHKADQEIEYIGRTEIRNISYMLHPMLLRLGLVPALKSMGERFAEHFDVHVHVSEKWPSGAGVGGKENLPESLLLTVYRIVEEALSNVMKHASASTVDIYLDVETGPTLTVAVRDDGVGLVDSNPAVGFGFGMISARVEDAGGTWEIKSEPGRGTRLDVKLPVKEDDEKGAADGTRTI